MNLSKGIVWLTIVATFLIFAVILYFIFSFIVYVLHRISFSVYKDLFSDQDMSFEQYVKIVNLDFDDDKIESEK